MSGINNYEDCVLPYLVPANGRIPRFHTFGLKMSLLEKYRACIKIEDLLGPFTSRTTPDEKPNDIEFEGPFQHLHNRKSPSLFCFLVQYYA